jgi:mannose-6-phosphate isomerase-like protein (cupin superfamily)
MTKINKPWGFERIIHNSKKYLFKELFMKKGHQCSLQYHNHKYETVYVIKGKLLVILKKNNKYVNKILRKGDFLTIDKKVIHRMKALSDCIYLEASTAHPKDVVRIEDDYARV